MHACLASCNCEAAHGVCAPQSSCSGRRERERERVHESEREKERERERGRVGGREGGGGKGERESGR